MVRSKSELAIAIELQRLGLWGQCEYERVLEGTARPGRLRPDFTFIDAAGDPLVWEHLGMLSKRSYQESGNGSSGGTPTMVSSSARTFTTQDDASGALTRIHRSAWSAGVERRVGVDVVVGASVSAVAGGVAAVRGRSRASRASFARSR
jgi:hypothetical protein